MKRHGNIIIIEKGLTATEGMDGNLPTLSIRRNGKQIKFYRGSSLMFCDPLTEEDKQYLASLSKE